VLAVLVILRGAAWYAYQHGLVVPDRSREVLQSLRPWMLWAGLVAPLLFIAVGLASAAGLLVLATGWALKFVLVTRAAYQQGFELKRGTAAIRPGWTHD
jgi:phenylacetyl-CoA:acceptor oxidoreductase subunit 2